MKNGQELQKYYAMLRNTPLFAGISEEDLDTMLSCLGATVRNYEKNEILLMAGTTVTNMGIVLAGSLNITKEDILGNRMIITEITEGELFGEIYACAGVVQSPVTVVATKPSKILYLAFSKLVTTCGTHCGFHHRLIENMLSIMAVKNMQLNQKMSLLSKRTTKDKLLEYFQIQMEKQHSEDFTIPFSRNELADYLCVDRSALSRELGKLRDEGMISYHRNQFRFNKEYLDFLS